MQNLTSSVFKYLRDFHCCQGKVDIHIVMEKQKCFFVKNKAPIGQNMR